ncbi:MAG: KOW motif-containing protein [Candidatus Moeniiplasma glomeromycotorum]|nr:KOW motif-containing protein [Candidatus Moeniiplasma glomeromycotorum]
MKELNYQWYILTVRGGREEKITAKIKLELEKKGWGDCVRDLKIISDNQKKNILKGYLFGYCHLTPELIRFFYQIPEITGFLDYQWGDSELPEPVSEEMVKNLLARVEERKEISAEFSQKKPDLNVGDLVKITAGVFADREGRITHLDPKKQKVKITVESSGWEVSDVPVNFCQKILD